MPLNAELLGILACPKCKGPLEYRKEGNQLLCQACRLAYEVKDDIPVMILEQAKPF